AAVDRGWVLFELAEERGSLEDVFVQLTTRDAAAADAEEAAALAAAGEPTPAAEPRPAAAEDEVPS
ncbi:MAG TPA: ABC transporter ATP-binding protein, partial [Thermoanaerobaculia bacterium]|nr:ABC transporter ATP-binding protein [Thermoanaerobaculia bacterium]